MSNLYETNVNHDEIEFIFQLNGLDVSTAFAKAWILSKDVTLDSLPEMGTYHDAISVSLLRIALQDYPNIPWEDWTIDRDFSW